MSFDFGKITSAIGKGLNIAEKVANGVDKFGKIGLDLIKTPVKDIELPVKNDFLKGILGTVDKVLGTAKNIAAPFRNDLHKIPFVGNFVDKAADFLFDTAHPFIQKSVVGNFSILNKFLPTVEAVVNFAGKAGEVLSKVTPYFPVEQHNAAQLAARHHANALAAN